MRLLIDCFVNLKQILQLNITFKKPVPIQPKTGERLPKYRRKSENQPAARRAPRRCAVRKSRSPAQVGSDSRVGSEARRGPSPGSFGESASHSCLRLTRNCGKGVGEIRTLEEPFSTVMTPHGQLKSSWCNINFQDLLGNR